jgi:hypothetical protein
MSGQLLVGPQGAFHVGCALVLLAVAVIAVVYKPVIAPWAVGAAFAVEDAMPVSLDTSLLRASWQRPLDVGEALRAYSRTGKGGNKGAGGAPR